MADKQISIVHPEKGEGAVGPELLKDAIDKGWKLAGDVDIAHPDKGAGVMGPGQEDLLREAIGKGWSIAGDEPEPAQEPPTFVPGQPAAPAEPPVYDMRQDVQEAPATPLLPEVPAAADQEPFTLASAGQAVFSPESVAENERRNEAVSAARFQQEIVEQRAREEAEARLQAERGVNVLGGPGANVFTPEGAKRAVQLAGNNLAQGAAVGLDAPMALAQTAVKDAADYYGRDDGNAYAQTVPVEQARAPGLLAGVRPDVVADMQAIDEANPTGAVAFNIAGAALPALATGGATLGAGGAAVGAAEFAPGVVSRVAQAAVKAAPAGWLANAAAKLGIRTAGLATGGTGAALEAAPGLSGALSRAGAIGIKLGVEGAVEGGAQGAGQALNDTWLNNDTASAWDYFTAGLSGGGTGVAFGGLLGTFGGTGLGLGAEVGRKVGLVADDAPTRLLRSLGLSSERKALSEPMDIRTRNDMRPTLQLTPAQVEKRRLGTFRRFQDGLNEMLGLKRQIEIDPTKPPPLRPQQVEGLREIEQRGLQSQLDEFTDIAQKVDFDPTAPRPLPPQELEAVHEQAFKTLRADIDDFVSTKRKLQLQAEPPKKAPAQLQKEADDLYVDTESRLNELLRLNGHLEENVDLAAKKAWTRREANTPLTGNWDRDRIRELIDLPDDFLESLQEHSGVKFTDAGKVAKLRASVSKQVDELTAEAESRQLTVGDLHIAFDQIKRTADKLLGSARKRNEFLYEALQGRVEKLRAGLMNEAPMSANVDADFFPETVASGQRLTNSTWSKSISASTDSELGAALGDIGTKAEWNGFDNPERINSGWLDPLMNNAGDPRSRQRLEAITRFLDAKAEDFLTRSKVYGSEEMAKMAGKLADESAAVKANFAKAAEVSAAQRQAFEPVSAAASSAKDAALSGMLGRSGKFDPTAPVNDIERVQPAWLKTHIKGRGTAYEAPASEALADYLNEQAFEAAELAQRLGTKEAEAAAVKVAALRDKALSELVGVETLNAAQKLPPPVWDAAAAAESDAALQGMLGRSGKLTEGARDAADQPVRFQAGWLDGHVKSRGTPSAAQQAEALDMWLDARVKRAEDVAFTRGDDESVRAAAKLAELRENLRGRLGTVDNLNGQLRKPDAPMTPSQAATADGNIQGLLLKQGDASAAPVYSLADLPEQVNPQSLDGLLKSFGDVRTEQSEVALINFLNAHADEAIEIARQRGTQEAAEVADRIHTLRRELKNNIDQVAQWNLAQRKGGNGDWGVMNWAPRSYELARDAFTGAMYSRSLKTLERVDELATLKNVLVPSAPGAASRGVAGASVRGARDLGDKVDKAIDELFDDSPPRQQEREEDRQQIERIMGPEVAMAAAQSFEQRRQWLMQKAGGMPSDPAARARMQRYMPAALDPLPAVGRMANGTASNEDREALRELHAPIYQRFATQALKTLQSKRDELTYDQRLKASRSIGLPLDASLEPAKLNQLQQLANTSAGPEAQGSAMLSPSQTRAPDMASILER